MDSAQKRNRNRKQREKREDKERRRKERAERKLLRVDDPTLPEGSPELGAQDQVERSEPPLPSRAE